MNIVIKGTNIAVTDQVRNYAQKRLEKLDRYLPNISEARLELGKEQQRNKEQPTAQLTVRNTRGVILRAEDKKQLDWNAAIDVVLDKMYRQIERYKGKSKKRRGNERWIETEWAGVEAIPMDDEPLDEGIDYDEQVKSEVVRRKIVMLTPMSEMEAIDQMELLGHSFFLFYNGEEDTINVLYRRSDDSYGILTPRVD